MRFLDSIWLNHYSKCLVISYWLLGLCNNFAYVIMLSAAHDILSDHKNETNTTVTNTTNKYDCNDISTGAILLADIIPGIIVKLIAPFFVHRVKYSMRVTFVIITCASSFLIVALTPSNLKWLTFIGVMCASVSSSFGEITFLSLSTLYNRVLALSGWGSGTGAAGIGGSLIYAALTTLAGVSPRTTILIMLFIPVLLAISYIFLPPFEKVDDVGPIVNPLYGDENPDETGNNRSSNENFTFSFSFAGTTSENSENKSSDGLFDGKFLENIKLLKTLLKYMIPLFLVYFAEYFINQGLFELLYFKDAFIKNHKDQYRWYNVVYQLAVFISRSSIAFLQIKFLPIFPILQLINVGIVLSIIFYGYVKSIWIVFLIIFWEGLLGGGLFVLNSFNQKIYLIFIYRMLCKRF
jgi:battenin